MPTKVNKHAFGWNFMFSTLSQYKKDMLLLFGVVTIPIHSIYTYIISARPAGNFTGLRTATTIHTNELSGSRVFIFAEKRNFYALLQTLKGS